jgi:endonuclease/exonuclease/phosphatase (EEP) superfamily protein YafD
MGTSLTPADAQPTPEPPQPPRRRLRLRLALSRALTLLSGAYLVLVVAVWLTLRFAADRWWGGTLLMFGPRWVWGLPLALLVPMALLLRRWRLLVPLAFCATLWLGPVSGLCVPWRRVLATADTSARPLRILTCNADGGALEPAALDAYVNECRPDVIVVQSPGRADRHLFADRPGWRLVKGFSFWLAVREPAAVHEVAQIEDADMGMGEAGPVATVYRLDTPAGPLALASVHLATPRRALEAVIRRDGRVAERTRTNIASRRRQFEALEKWAAGAPEPAVIAGDFNSPPESALFREHLGGFTDAFGAAGWGTGNTYFTRHSGVRIDHVLAGRGWVARRCFVGPDVGSAHRPLVADLYPVAQPAPAGE